jgi:hypothetical protein
LIDSSKSLKKDIKPLIKRSDFNRIIHLAFSAQIKVMEKGLNTASVNNGQLSHLGDPSIILGNKVLDSIDTMQCLTIH